MNKLILVAVAGLCFGNIYAKNPKKDKAEEGFYNPQIEMFAHFKTKSSFHKTKRII